MRLVGLTGGIGAGKTSCAGIFECLGVSIYYSDLEARRLMNEDPNVREKIIDLLGPRSYYKKKGLNRGYLAKRIFANKDLLTAINLIVHPAVRADFLQWSAVRAHEHYVIQESAILFETGAHRFFGTLILVDAPVETRIERVMKRDVISRQEVLERMNNQWPSKEKRKLATYIIENDGNTPIIRQILEIHHSILRDP